MAFGDKIMSKVKKVVLILIGVILAIAFIVGAVFAIRYFQYKKFPSHGPYYDKKVRSFDKENRHLSSVEVIFLGDSLTDGCDIGNYYGEYSALNRGINGDTTYGLFDRLEISAYDAHPKVIVLLIGGNDILGGKTLDSIYLNYKKLIEGIKKHLPETKIVWCSLTVLGNEWAKYNDMVKECNVRIEEMAALYGCAFVDLYTPLCGKEDILAPEYTIEGVHLTHEGYLVISDKIKTAIKNVY